MSDGRRARERRQWARERGEGMTDSCVGEGERGEKDGWRLRGSGGGDVGLGFAREIGKSKKRERVREGERKKIVFFFFLELPTP